MDLKQELLRITATYFENTIDYGRLTTSSKAYGDLLKRIIDTELDHREAREDIHFNNGKALGPLWAAMCLDDIMRTRQFVRGIEKAFKDKIKTNTKLQVLYAGTGPFATLLLPVLLRYPNANISYTFLEINPISLKLVKHVVSTLGLDNYDISFVQDDASCYRYGAQQPDIIISETMQRALDKEQQVPIFYNLMQQAKPEAIFIPEKIKLFLATQTKGIPSLDLGNTHYHKLVQVYEVSKESMIDSVDTNALHFPKVNTVINKDQLKERSQLYVLTDIQVYEDEHLLVNQSGLTVPKPIPHHYDDFNSDLHITTQYCVGAVPELEVSIQTTQLA
ncbi:hypothetical protein [uncultured Psychroserpens sp.]|uniref:hypothetical protein n=1 Tax=uncultured Psychroserpens sp. TaxID=255436 RepID=UPI00261C2FFF|nr:hypothetical protein [uncultured Psychroserpens sp.]